MRPPTEPAAPPTCRMQDGRGHRMAIMSADGDYTNVGIAMVPKASPYGPLVTSGAYCCYAWEGAADHFNRFLVGTVWRDLNCNDRYDPGEGLGGVTVSPDAGTYYAVTGDSGGYALPLTTTGSLAVVLTGPGIRSGAAATVTVGADSVLLDLRDYGPAFHAPDLAGVVTLLLALSTAV